VLVPWLDRTNRAKLDYLELPTWHPARLGWGIAMVALLGVFTIAAYDQELSLSKGVLQVAVLVVPLALGGLGYSVGRSLARRRGVPAASAGAGERNAVSPLIRERSQ